VVLSFGFMVCAVQDVSECGLILNAEKERGERGGEGGEKRRKGESTMRD
jgi:hypothetical protein